MRVFVSHSSGSSSFIHIIIPSAMENSAIIQVKGACSVHGVIFPHADVPDVHLDGLPRFSLFTFFNICYYRKNRQYYWVNRVPFPVIAVWPLLGIDLVVVQRGLEPTHGAVSMPLAFPPGAGIFVAILVNESSLAVVAITGYRSEERRVGKEGEIS